MNISNGEKLNYLYLLLFLMFVPVHPDEFMVGTKYKFAEHIGTYVDIGHNIHGIRHYKFNLQGRIRVVSSTLDFYQFIPQHPQWKMERRSVNMIVRSLIGDECFEW